MISPVEMRVLDRNAEYFGASIAVLMENAGRAVAERAQKEFAVEGKRVVVVCGTGNNGGDGLVAARYLKDHATVTVILAKTSSDFATDLARDNFEKLRGRVRVVEAARDARDHIADSDLVIDALIGIGAGGDLKEPYVSLIRAMNESGRPILAVDVPSGFDTATPVRATATVALHDAKAGIPPEVSGRVFVADIGIPPEVADQIGPGEMLLYPKPHPESHKGQNGRLLVVGGGPFTGAPAFVALAAYRIGVDAAHVATPAISYGPIASYSPNLIVHPLGGNRLLKADLGPILEVASGMDAVVVGPGLGASDGTKEAIRALIRSVNLPLVIDADAITAVSEDLACLQGRTGVVTPHHREYETLSHEGLPGDLPTIISAVRGFARKIGFTILLKGPVDVVTDGERHKLNRIHNVGMTVGGTGDALAGITGGLLAKHARPYDAARMAAFANGHAGNLAFTEMSYGMATTDLIERIPRVLRDFVSGPERPW